ncbi:MAG: ribonuclease HIII [Bacilli bacterium]
MNIVFKVSDNIKEKMITYYEDLKREKTPPYALFQADESDTIITLYESGKVMFQGISADVDAAMWKDQEKFLNNRDIDITDSKEKKKEIDKSYYYFNAIGSDEVGTGDYLLPIVVTATFVQKEDLSLLEGMHIGDSKKMTDEKILSCAPIIMKKIPYESLILSNKDYNMYHDKGFNMNKVKAIMHNKVLYKMKEKNYPYHKIIVDQFALPRNYYLYIKDSIEKVTNITFLTKAEDKNLSVACASVISRYIFLKECDKLSKEYNIEFPKGAGTKVDEIAKELVTKYGKDTLSKVSKVSFKNTEKII